jgi:diacylglycerol kinase family enzyme
VVVVGWAELGGAALVGANVSVGASDVPGYVVDDAGDASGRDRPITAAEIASNTVAAPPTSSERRRDESPERDRRPSTMSHSSPARPSPSSAIISSGAIVTPHDGQKFAPFGIGARHEMQPEFAARPMVHDASGDDSPSYIEFSLKPLPRTNLDNRHYRLAMRVLLVVNSFASSVTARNKVIIEQTLQDAGFDVSLRETNRRGHATRFAQDAALRGVEVVVGLGGDGTLNEVANGLVGTDTMLGVLPGGSTNVFARTIGLENDPVAAAHQLADALAAKSVQRIGLGRVNGRYFCFHTGVGYDAAVVANVEKRASVKRWLGHPLFIYAALRTYASKYDRKNPHYVATFDDGTVVEDGYFSVVLNTNPYTYLGNRPLNLAPKEGLTTPLSVVTFRTLSLVPMLTAVSRAFTGDGVRGKGIVTKTDVHAVTFEYATPFPYQLDGDYLGETNRLAFTWEADAISLIVPVKHHR